MTTRTPEWVKAVAGPLLVAATAVALAVRTWQIWGDPVVDFGRDVYLAWRLSEGAVIYRDVAHFNGPLASYVNAAWFDVIGTGLVQLVALNLLVLAAITTALFMICRSAGDRLAATAAAIVFLSLQGFGYFGVGTFNFVTPYSHELTFGLLLGLLAVAAAGEYARSGSSRWALAAGMCVGLSFLTKPETFLAASFAAGVGLATAGWYRTGNADGHAADHSRGRRACLAAVCGGAALPPVAAFAALAAGIGPSAAADGLLRQWRMVADPRVTGLPFYQALSGLDAVASNLLALAAWTLGGTVALLVLAWSSPRIGTHRSRGAIAFTAVLLAAIAASLWVPWHRIWFVLPAGVAVTLMDSGWRLARRDGDAGREVTTLALGTLALILLAKQGLRPQIFHYGFALAVPAVAVCVVSLVARIPSRLPRGAGVFRAGALGLIMAVALFHLGLSQAAVEVATASSARVGVGPDALRADSRRARVLQEVIERVQRERVGASLAVLPEGAYLNFVLRRVNPTPFVQLMPPELITWGEDVVLAAYRRSPPDLVVLVHHDWSEYGRGPFGEGHARNLMTWLRENYRSIHVVGDPPFTEEGGFGAEILERKEGATPRNPSSRESVVPMASVETEPERRADRSARLRRSVRRTQTSSPHAHGPWQPRPLGSVAVPSSSKSPEAPGPRPKPHSQRSRTPLDSRGMACCNPLIFRTN